MRRSADRGPPGPHIAKSELVGLAVEVVASRDPTLRGLTGVVVDETRNTFVIERPGGREARVAKKGQAFAFALPDGSRVVVEGARLAFAPQDRTKKAR